MRQGINTRYLGPTNARGSRIKATARKASALGKEMSHTQQYGYGNTEEEHTSAAKALATKLGWVGTWVGGGTPDENGFHYVNLGNTALPQRTHGEDASGRYMPEGLREGVDFFYVERV